MAVSARFSWRSGDTELRVKTLPEKLITPSDGPAEVAASRDDQLATRALLLRGLTAGPLFAVAQPK